MFKTTPNGSIFLRIALITKVYIFNTFAYLKYNKVIKVLKKNYY